MSNRVKREEEFYNNEESVNKAVAFQSVFGHANGPSYYSDYIKNFIRTIMEQAKGVDALELGSTCWASWLDLEDYHPDSITCINISQKELTKGIKLLDSTPHVDKGRIEFRIMDIHCLEFADNSFDVVFGSGILHHLDFETALFEICRVLRPGGFCLFDEPLISNPVSKLVRRLTPRARTPDEKPLGKNELLFFKQLFDAEYLFYQLFHVPAGVISAKLFRSPYNRFMKLSFIIDKFLDNYSPFWFKLLFRYVLIVGKG